MITLKRGKKEIVLHKIKNFGILWKHEDNPVSFQNSLLKIPGGNFLETHSDFTLNDISVQIVASRWEMDLLKQTSRDIADLCLGGNGLPVEIELYKAYDSGFRRVKLSNIKTNFDIKEPSIDLSFTLLDPYIYGEIVTKQLWSAKISSGPSTATFTKTNGYGSLVDIEITGANVRNLTIKTTRLSDDKTFSISLGTCKGDITFNNKQYRIVNSTGDVLTRIPKDFKFYNRLAFYGTGTVQKIKLTYREVTVV